MSKYHTVPNMLAIFLLLVKRITIINSLSNNLIPNEFGRRKLMSDFAFGTIAALVPSFVVSSHIFINPETAMAVETTSKSDLTAEATKSVAVFGANEGTVKACASVLLQTSRTFVASSRSDNVLYQD